MKKLINKVINIFDPDEALLNVLLNTFIMLSITGITYIILYVMSQLIYIINYR